MTSEDGRLVHGFRRMTFGELAHRPRTPRHWLVENLLPAGLTVFAGKSKVGKSIMLMQLVQCIGLGDPFLGLPTKQQRVLYLALEDGEDLTQDRLLEQEEICEQIECQWGWPVGRKGVAALLQEIESGRYGLVVVDTMARVLGMAFDPNKVEHMTAALGPLQQAALAHKVALMDIDHHSNKTSGDDEDGDPVADIMGSSGKGQVADCIWGLYRGAKGARATLKAKGRRVPLISIPLQTRTDGLGWDLRVDARHAVKEASESAIVKALRDLGPADAGKVAEVIERDRSGTRKTLARMTEEGRLVSQDSKTDNGSALVLYSLR